MGSSHARSGAVWKRVGLSICASSCVWPAWDAGCDTVRFHPAKADAKVKAQYCNGGRTDLPLVLFVGRMAPEKQVELLPAMIEAVNPPGQKPVCRFALIGGGPSADFIRAATAGRACGADGRRERDSGRGVGVRRPRRGVARELLCGRRRCRTCRRGQEYVRGLVLLMF